MPIRRLNYTKRRKLSRQDVRISLSGGNDGQPMTFQAEFQLPPGLPGSARIFVEAYRASPAARMRFPFGTVDAIRHPSRDACRLSEFANDLPPLFRVKITDTSGTRGRLLAEAHQIQPVLPEDTPDRRVGILYTAWRNNDGLVWDLDLETDTGPTLYLDQHADPFHELPARLEFKALVYPEIMRRVLTQILGDDDSLEDPEGWQPKWARFPRSLGFTEPIPSDRESRDDWIDRAVRWCARKAGFVAALAPREGES